MKSWYTYWHLFKKRLDDFKFACNVILESKGTQKIPFIKRKKKSLLIMKLLRKTCSKRLRFHVSHVMSRAEDDVTKLSKYYLLNAGILFHELAVFIFIFSLFIYLLESLWQHIYSYCSHILMITHTSLIIYIYYIYTWVESFYQKSPRIYWSPS